jgi:hypothetical protein
MAEGSETLMETGPAGDREEVGREFMGRNLIGTAGLGKRESLRGAARPRSEV